MIKHISYVIKHTNGHTDDNNLFALWYFIIIGSLIGKQFKYHQLSSLWNLIWIIISQESHAYLGIVSLRLSHLDIEFFIIIQYWINQIWPIRFISQKEGFRNLDDFYVTNILLNKFQQNIFRRKFKIVGCSWLFLYKIRAI